MRVFRFRVSLTSLRKYTVHFPFDLSFVQDEIQRRPRISTLLESLSKYEAVAPTQEDDEEGAEAKTTTSSQVKMKLNVTHTTLNKAESSDRFVVCVHCGLMQIVL